MNYGYQVFYSFVGTPAELMAYLEKEVQMEQFMTMQKRQEEAEQAYDPRYEE